MRRHNARPARALRPDDRGPGADGDGPGGLRGFVPGDGGARSTARHRTAGRPRSIVRGRGPRCRAFTSRGAACIRGRGCRWPRYRAGWAAAALFAGSRGLRASTSWFAENGYAWWYVDALSDDGAHALTIIAFIGSVFSPYYAWARQRGRGDPENHVAVNVALYGTPGKWGDDRTRAWRAGA